MFISWSWEICYHCDIFCCMYNLLTVCWFFSSWFVKLFGTFSIQWHFSKKTFYGLHVLLYSKTCLKWTTLDPEFGLYRLNKQRFPTSGLYFTFGLYRILFYSDFSLYRILFYSGFSLYRIPFYSAFALDRFHYVQPIVQTVYSCEIFLFHNQW